MGSLRAVLNGLLSLGAGLPCEGSHERGALLRSRCNVDYVPADECEGRDDRAVAQAMQLLRRLSVDVLMQRCVCDLLKPFLPACGACPPGEDVRNPNRMTTNPPFLTGAENPDRNVAVTLAQRSVPEHQNGEGDCAQPKRNAEQSKYRPDHEVALLPVDARSMADVPGRRIILNG